MNNFNYREMRELANTLIIPKNANGAVRLPQIEALEEINNLVPESHLVHGSSTIGGWVSEAFLYHEENHNVAVLHRNPELAYEKVVTHSYQVNRIAKRYADSQTSLRVEPLHNSLRVTQNSTSSRGPVTYKNFVGQRLCGTQRPAQHNPESSWQFTALRGVTLFTEIKTLVLLWIRPPTVDQ
ncbi:MULTISPECIES: hypothetical protein [Klebsiella pneumoniae complex]|nr:MULTISPECIES: hypothetical protein [Klebsiella]UDC63888.1 hypothetical protein LGM21_14270 [Klebsiella quasipneumoniae subsp. quasipneumoniae]CDN03838.1 hypothetical protein KPSB59_4270043 [Klebsiella quasipneumoniae subsp. quasipneumoniae]HBU7490070.1 hypothetical protein [Klebsiella oxytoca]HBV5299525.1 hypothetical protein [Klebsiella oxytoca]